MTAERRLVLFRQLGTAELWIARVLRRLGFDVCFLEPLGTLRSKAAIESLRDERIVWLKASELHGLHGFQPMEESHRLTCKVTDRLFPLQSLAVLGRQMPSPANDAVRLRILLYELLRGYLTPHGLTVAVGSVLRQQGYRVYLWQRDGLALVLARPGFRNLYPVLLSLVVKLFEKLVARMLRSERSLGKSGRDAVELSRAGLGCDRLRSAEVLYFAHQGPNYGDLFAKDQYYVSDTASSLHRSHICHVELAGEMSDDTVAEVIRSYRDAGLSCQWLPGPRRFRVSLRELVPLAMRIGFVAAFLGLMVRHRFVESLEQLADFPRARLALLGYEYNFPRVMAAALQARGIVVAAAQERFLQPFHPGFHLILDRYFVHGPKPAAAVRDNSLCSIGAITVTGDLRQPRKSRQRRNGPHRCLVLDYHSVESPFLDALAFDNSWANNRLFLEDILQLSADFPDVQFTIRGKNARWVELPVFENLVAAISARANLRVDMDRALDRSYVLLADSDSVIARHTSLGDQALAMGMPTLFHERMVTSDRAIAAVMDYSPYPLLTYSYDELHNKFAEILHQGHILDAAQTAALRREFYAQPANPHPREQAAEILKSILAETRNISCHGVVGVTP
jgi:hypothetical protein